jgi:acyl carrier protein
VVWARRRFNQQLQSLLAELAGQRPYSAADDLLALVAGYAQAIGDVDQQLAGEDRQPDALLQRSAAKAMQAPMPAPAGALCTLRRRRRRWRRHPCHRPRLRAGLAAHEGRQNVERIDPDTAFAALGMDSLATASIAVDLEQRLGMPIVPELLFDYQSVNELAGFLARPRTHEAPSPGAPNDRPPSP